MVSGWDRHSNYHFNVAIFLLPAKFLFRHFQARLGAYGAGLPLQHPVIIGSIH